MLKLASVKTSWISFYVKNPELTAMRRFDRYTGFEMPGLFLT